MRATDAITVDELWKSTVAHMTREALSISHNDYLTCRQLTSVTPLVLADNQEFGSK